MTRNAAIARIFNLNDKITAKQSSGILGPFTGKIGPVVGARWKGVYYVRSVPSKNGKKPSEGQIANRAKFRFMSQWLEPLHPYVNVGFFAQHNKLSEINHAFQVNYREALQGTYPNFSIDYTKVCVSKGVLSPPDVGECELLDSGKLTLTWRSDTGRLAAHDDQVMLVLFSPVLHFADGAVGIAKRSDGALVYRYANRLEGQEVEMYLSFIALNRKRVSNSIYLGRMVLL